LRSHGLVDLTDAERIAQLEARIVQLDAMNADAHCRAALLFVGAPIESTGLS
jgi:hypothetical protein